MVETGPAQAHDAGLSALPSMGGISFGANAFPTATQAAFGGMGGLGYGVGYGGSSQGASISVPATFFGTGAAAGAPAGQGSTNLTGLIVIAGIILAVILVIGMMGGKHHKGRR
jgi:hypothetical protein